ncbi:MAG: dTDP-4-dehydrorhamnose reductase, partial [Verrucomicrobiales bacterium]|nr:dTDP-4-dehydrorhamnose reductase [Verrucomicrobiales bacterium]
TRAPAAGARSVRRLSPPQCLQNPRPGMTSPSGSLEMWGGIECTVSRVGDRWMDQLACSGHDTRISDLNLFAELGLKTLRYPFLWERTAPHKNSKGGWEWARTRLDRLSKLKIRPIAGLLHHGSGPPGICLTDPEFPASLAAYAGEFAARHPGVEDYTPVNEPLTTARFSGLYGLWFPHGTSDRTFVKALFNQCKGVVLAMRAARRVNSSARLVQTEDMGRIFSTPELSEQADFENERRWLSLDLLCGRVTPDHALWNYLLGAGFTDREVLWFSENPCPPDIIGINHYALSNRYLDHRLENFPEHCHGGNGRQRYADIGAVRAGHLEPYSLDKVLLEVWHRYRLPVAVTEAHLDCTREEQMRWLHEFWECAGKARSQGADVRAVTVWGLLGLHNWRSLLTRPQSGYESGVFDLSGGTPRPTALAAQVKALAGKGAYSHPVLEVPGWWCRDSRVLSPRPLSPGPFPASSNCSFGPAGSYANTAPLLIVRDKDCRAEACAAACEIRGIPWRFAGFNHLDAGEGAELEKSLGSLKPWAVIHTAELECDGGSDPAGGGHADESAAMALQLALACAKRAVPFMTFSGKSAVCQASHQRNDSGVSAHQCAGDMSRAERKVLKACSQSLVIRISAPQETAKLAVCADGFINASLDLLMDQARGLWHPIGGGEGRVLLQPVAPCQARLLQMEHVSHKMPRRASPHGPSLPPARRGRAAVSGDPAV